jgi:hypothetical protein
VLEAERRAAKTVAGLLRLYPEVRHANPEHAGFVDEVVTMLVAYLTCEAHSKGVQ